MISDEYKCIFIHTPKCAGESIETAFLGKPLNISRYEGHFEKHWGIRETSKKYPAKFAAYFKFSVVRNPWDRVVSWVKYRDKRYNRIAGTFEDRLWTDLNDPRFVGFMQRHSFHNMLYINGTISVDYIIRMERLQAGFDAVCDRIGMERTLLPHQNRTEHQHYAQYYTALSRDSVARLFAGDIALFDYEFDAV